MRISAVARSAIASLAILGVSNELIAQGGPRAVQATVHRVSVVVPTILSLRPPDPTSTDQSWQIKTNDPSLRRRLVLGGATPQWVGDTLLVTLTPP